MKIRIALACLLATTMIGTAWGAEGPAAVVQPARSGEGIPQQLDAAQRDGYRAVFASIRDEKWIDARLQLAQMKPGPLHAIAMAEIVAAKGSPRADDGEITRLLTEAPELPQAETLARLASAHGVSDLPALPYVRAMTWQGTAPARRRAKSTRSDAVAADLAIKMQPYVKGDMGPEAEALLNATGGLSPEAQTEWRQRVAWIYYLQGNDGKAREIAALGSAGTGDWAVQSEWVAGLAAWRQHDYVAAGRSFEAVSTRASDVDMRAAGLYWASRADLANRRPDLIEARLKSAAQYDETFYGLLARQALAIRTGEDRGVDARTTADWQMLQRRPNIRVAAALVEIGELGLADQVMRRQAKIGDPLEFPALARLAGSLDLAATQIWLSHNGPDGAPPSLAARYPSPNWTPDGGWRVDKALIYAHTLQESRFRTDVVSPAGAYGLMQLRPGTASDVARQRGLRADRAALARPSTNIEIGQSYLEFLRDQDCTGGLLPKVVAAYNAGPVPVGAWNAQSRDGGDPLLYIESIPYWETRGYVVTVLRNYWVYEREQGKKASPSRAALAQGLWPRFPGLPGAPAVRLTGPAKTTASAN